MSVAGRDDRAPDWLVWWGAAAGLAAVVTVVAIFTDGLSTYGMIIVPVGIGWTIAAGVALLRRAAGGTTAG